MKLTLEELESLCRCGHARKVHVGKLRDEDCCSSNSDFTFCKCKRFRLQVENQEEDEMAKKERKTKVARGSNLLYFADKAKIEKHEDGKLLDKKEKTYVAAIARTLVDAGKDGLSFEALVTAVGKIVEHKNEKTLRNSVRWYLGTKKSGVFKFVESKRVEGEKKPKAAKAAKPKAAKRAKKARSPKANGAADEQATASASEEQPERD